MTIEERAENYANKLRCEAYCPAHGFGTGDYEPEEGLSEEEYTYSIDGYTAGATEQREIDIQRAVEWLSSRLCFPEIDRDLFIESLEQAMKVGTK